jgi:hypothetical protein
MLGYRHGVQVIEMATSTHAIFSTRFLNKLLARTIEKPAAFTK